MASFVAQVEMPPGELYFPRSAVVNFTIHRPLSRRPACVPVLSSLSPRRHYPPPPFSRAVLSYDDDLCAD